MEEKDLLSFDEENSFTITDENGNEQLCKIFLTLENTYNCEVMKENHLKLSSLEITKLIILLPLNLFSIHLCCIFIQNGITWII